MATNRLPVFSEGDPESWISAMEGLWCEEELSDNEIIQVALEHMDGRAKLWVLSNLPLTSDMNWCDFMYPILWEFGKPPRAESVVGDKIDQVLEVSFTDSNSNGSDSGQVSSGEISSSHVFSSSNLTTIVSNQLFNVFKSNLALYHNEIASEKFLITNNIDLVRVYDAKIVSEEACIQSIGGLVSHSSYAQQQFDQMLERVIGQPFRVKIWGIDYVCLLFEEHRTLKKNEDYDPIIYWGEIIMGNNEKYMELDEKVLRDAKRNRQYAHRISCSRVLQASPKMSGCISLHLGDVASFGKMGDSWISCQKFPVMRISVVIMTTNHMIMVCLSPNIRTMQGYIHNFMVLQSSLKLVIPTIVTGRNVLVFLQSKMYKASFQLVSYTINIFRYKVVFQAWCCYFTDLKFFHSTRINPGSLRESSSIRQICYKYIASNNIISISNRAIVEDLTSNSLNFTIGKDSGPVEEDVVAILIGDPAMMCHDQINHDSAVRHMDLVFSSIDQAVTGNLYSDIDIFSPKSVDSSNAISIFSEYAGSIGGILEVDKCNTALQQFGKDGKEGEYVLDFIENIYNLKKDISEMGVYSVIKDASSSTFVSTYDKYFVGIVLPSSIRQSTQVTNASRGDPSLRLCSLLPSRNASNVFNLHRLSYMICADKSKTLNLLIASIILYHLAQEASVRLFDPGILGTSNGGSTANLQSSYIDKIQGPVHNRETDLFLPPNCRDVRPKVAAISGAFDCVSSFEQRTFTGEICYVLRFTNVLSLIYIGKGIWGSVDIIGSKDSLRIFMRKGRIQGIDTLREVLYKLVHFCAEVVTNRGTWMGYILCYFWCLSLDPYRIYGIVAPKNIYLREVIFLAMVVMHFFHSGIYYFHLVAFQVLHVRTRRQDIRFASCPLLMIIIQEYTSDVVMKPPDVVRKVHFSSAFFGNMIHLAREYVVTAETNIAELRSPFTTDGAQFHPKTNHGVAVLHFQFRDMENVTKIFPIYQSVTQVDCECLMGEFNSPADNSLFMIASRCSSLGFVHSRSLWHMQRLSTKFDRQLSVTALVYQVVEKVRGLDTMVKSAAVYKKAQDSTQFVRVGNQGRNVVSVEFHMSCLVRELLSSSHQVLFLWLIAWCVGSLLFLNCASVVYDLRDNPEASSTLITTSNYKLKPTVSLRFRVNSKGGCRASLCNLLNCYSDVRATPTFKIFASFDGATGDSPLLHPVFHIAQLKQALKSTVTVNSTIPPISQSGAATATPHIVQGSNRVLRSATNPSHVVQALLIQWAAEAPPVQTWCERKSFVHVYPDCLSSPSPDSDMIVTPTTNTSTSYQAIKTTQLITNISVCHGSPLPSLNSSSYSPKHSLHPELEHSPHPPHLDDCHNNHNNTTIRHSSSDQRTYSTRRPAHFSLRTRKSLWRRDCHDPRCRNNEYKLCRSNMGHGLRLCNNYVKLEGNG